MALTHRSRPPRSDGLGPEADRNPDPEEVLALLTTDHTQAILVAIAAEAKPARALVEACDVSRSTVYRRLNDLQDAGLVESGMRYSEDGHHRTVYQATLSGLSVDIADDGVSIHVATDRSGEALARPVQRASGRHA